MTHIGEHSDSTELDSVIDRVQKLLAVAERTSNEQEADAFARKASELIARFRLSPEAIRQRRPDGFTLREQFIGRGAYVRARFHLLAAIADGMGCLATYTVGPSGTTAQISGSAVDVETVHLVYTSLHLQMAQRASMRRRNTAAATQRYRRSFMFGFAEQVGEMLAKVEHEAMEHSSHVETLMPALLEHRQQVHEFAERRLGRIRSASRPAPAQRDGMRDGRHAAETADIGRRRVRHTPELPVGRHGQ